MLARGRKNERAGALMLQSTSLSDLQDAPLGKAAASWIGHTKQTRIGLRVTVPGERDRITNVPIKWMVQLSVGDAADLLASLVEALSQTEEGERRLEAITKGA